MSTNFYWNKDVTGRELYSDDPAIHIGKRVNGRTFIFAQPDFLVVTYLLSQRDANLVVDEYGKPYTGEQMIYMLALMEREHRVGEHFS